MYITCSSEVTLDDLPEEFPHDEELAKQLGMQKTTLQMSAEAAGINALVLAFVKKFPGKIEELMLQGEQSLLNGHTSEPGKRGGAMPSAARQAGYDQTLKRLRTQTHDDVLALLLPEARWISERSPELPSTLRQADLVWEVALSGSERLLLHVELQTSADALIGERLAEYAIRLWREYRLPVRSVIVYLRETGHVTEPPFVISRGGGEEGLRYPFDVVRL